MDDLIDQVLVLQLGALHTATTASLGAKSVRRNGLHVARAGHREHDLFVLNQVLDAELTRNGDVKARFLREGYLANAVEHAGAVSVIDDASRRFCSRSTATRSIVEGL